MILPNNSQYFLYRIAGISITSNRASNLPTDGFADLQLEVEFMNTNAQNLHDYASPDWYKIPGRSSPEIYLHARDNKAVVLEDEQLNQESCAMAIRRVVPFAAALKGEITLHASAVSINNQVVCFVAESGSGKSTLADALRDIGHPFISDDLLPCRYHNDEIMIPHLNGNSVSFLKISMICFLYRDSILGSLELKIISPKECLKLLLLNGFGELKNTAIWKSQFETYGSISSNFKAYKLTLPDDLSKLDKAVSELGSQFETITRENY